MSVLNQVGYDKLKSDELKTDAMAGIKALEAGMAGEIPITAFDKACDIHINKPYVNKDVVLDYVLNSGNPLMMFLIGLIPNMPKKSFMQKIIDTGGAKGIRRLY